MKDTLLNTIKTLCVTNEELLMLSQESEATFEECADYVKAWLLEGVERVKGQTTCVACDESTFINKIKVFYQEY